MAQAALTQEGFVLEEEESINSLFPGIIKKTEKKVKERVETKNTIKKNHRYARGLVGDSKGTLMKVFNPRISLFTVIENKKGEMISTALKEVWIVAKKSNGKPFTHEACEVEEPEKV